MTAVVEKRSAERKGELFRRPRNAFAFLLYKAQAVHHEQGFTVNNSTGRGNFLAGKLGGGEGLSPRSALRLAGLRSCK